MESIRLEFALPAEEDIAGIKIWEAPDATGPWTLIETVTGVGTYPDYISEYSTDLATSKTDWFAIAWFDSKGVQSELSAAWQGGTDTLVRKVVDRVRQRDLSLSVGLVTQEAEGAIQYALGNNVDPYDPTLTATYRQLNGLTYLVLARAIMVRQLSESSGQVESATLGLVSFRSSASSGAAVKTDVQSLIDMANKELRIATSVVLQLDDVITNTFTSFDQSRLIGWVGLV